MRFFTAIGFVSYALYLIHENLMIAMMIKLNAWIKSEAVMIALPIVVVAVLYYIAWLISKYAEPALRNALNLVVDGRVRAKES